MLNRSHTRAAGWVAIDHLPSLDVLVKIEPEEARS